MGDDRDSNKKGDAPLMSAPRHRSPAYPGISLEKAIGYATKLRGEIRHHAMPARVVAKGMGFTDEKNGAASVALSALRKFGLLEEAEGGLKLTGRALVLVIPGGNPIDRRKALRDCALAPKIYQELWAKWHDGLPNDDAIAYDLETSRNFNPKAVRGFIGDFRATMQYAGLTGKAEGSEDEGAPEEGTVKEGDLVQWACAGVDQFDAPRIVRGFSDDGQWAFVDGSETGLPVGELTIMNQKSDPTPSPVGQAAPPPNPFSKSGESRAIVPPARAGCVQEVKVLDEGAAVLQWPDELSQDSVADIEYWLEGIVRRLRRKAGLQPEKQQGE